jgi:hypothetical protein
MKRIALGLAVMAFASSAFAAGIDPRGYTCATLQGLIETNRFIFISAPIFGDFVVADYYYCPGSRTGDERSLPTSDNPQCTVKYCASRSVGGN